MKRLASRIEANDETASCIPLVVLLAAVFSFHQDLRSVPQFLVLVKANYKTDSAIVVAKIVARVSGYILVNWPWFSLPTWPEKEAIKLAFRLPVPLQPPTYAHKHITNYCLLSPYLHKNSSKVSRFPTHSAKAIFFCTMYRLHCKI